MTSDLRRAALARLRAPGTSANQVSHWDVPKECPSGTVAPRAGTVGTSGTVGTVGTVGTADRPVRLDHADVGERAAYVEHEGNVPNTYVEEFARLQQACPAGVPQARWWQFINDGGMFLDQWGVDAVGLRWSVSDLFGLDPIAPMARYDRMGLVWLLKGQKVTELGAEFARLSGGLRFARASCWPHPR